MEDPRIALRGISTIGGADGQMPMVSAGKLVYATPAAGGGGGGITHTALGNTGTGTAAENMLQYRVYLKKITIASAGLLSSVHAYVDNQANPGNVASADFAIWDDNNNAPNHLLTETAGRTTSLYIPSQQRWISAAFGRWLDPGSYWLGVQSSNATGVMRIWYGTGGGDPYYTSSGAWFADGGSYAVTTSTKNYCIRADLVT